MLRKKSNIDVEKLQEENMNLKRKCNLQLDKIFELEEQIKELKKIQINSTEVQNVSEELETNLSSPMENKEDEDSFPCKIDRSKQLENYSIALCNIMNDLQEEIFIPYKKTCQNSREYKKIQKEEFEKIILRFIDNLELKDFLEYMTSMGIIKCDGNKNIFPDKNDGKTLKVYLISKSSIEYFCRVNI